jgi:hypothetical protein
MNKYWPTLPQAISLASAVLVAAVVLCCPLRAEEAQHVRDADAVQTADTFSPGVLPAAVAIGPGFIVHGAGHWAAGERETAKELLGAEGAGAGLFISGLAMLAVSGASEKISVPSIAMSVAGAGLFFNSYFSDIYGSAGGAGRSPDHERDFYLRIGYGRIDDPLFVCRNILTVSSRAGMHDFGVEPFYSKSLDDDHSFSGARLFWRFWENESGSFAKVKTGATYRRNPSEYFSILTGELSVEGRFDHGLISPTLAGSFTEMQIGFARAWYDYDIPGYSAWSESTDVYILRTAFGFYFGTHNGEALVFYDHRRDQYAGGFDGGFTGNFGARIEYFPVDFIGCFAELTAGSAYVASFGMTLRR